MRVFKNNIVKASLLMFYTVSFLSGLAAEAEPNTAKPKVIEFYASWCQPCRDLAPAMNQAKSEYGQEVEFVRVDVDDPANRDLVKQYEVCPIPAVVFVDNHNAVSSYVIGAPEDRLINKDINKILPATHVNASGLQKSASES